MEEMFKQLMKEAVLEAFAEFLNGGIAVASDDSGNTAGNQTLPQDKEDNKKEPDSGKGGASEETSGGGIGPGGKPKPDVGVGGFSLR